MTQIKPICPVCGGNMRLTKIECKWLCKSCNESFYNNEIDWE